MQTADFLSRVIAPGNYIAIGFHRKPNPPNDKGGFSHRFFPPDKVSDAVGLLNWCVARGHDAYHAMASYQAAAVVTRNGRTYFEGRREGANTHKLRSFWVDLDIKRDGDKKKPEHVFADQREALHWIANFCRAVNLVRPNMVVSSGYGLHCYWVIEDALATADWLPYADALKSALIQHGFKGDAGISADAARVLRPPGTQNFKAATPVPVAVLDRATCGDWPNELVLTALRPFISQVAQSRFQAQASGQAASQGMAQALGGGGGQVHAMFQNAPAPNMAAAAQANIPPRARPRSFARIATQCLQVSTSLANHGDGDKRPLWYLGHLSLAGHCVDGADFVHPISDGDARYTPLEVDQAVAQIAIERARKDIGPPSCQHYEQSRPGVCASCPHFGRITSPWELGAADGDLPAHYRRNNGALEVSARGKDDNWYWTHLIDGNVHSPLLDQLETGGYALSFVYERAGKAHPVYVIGGLLTTEAGGIYKLFEQQHITLLGGNELRWRAFVLAWMDTLRANRAERTERVYPFGWAKDAMSGHVGFSVGGTLYRPNGVEEATPGCDPMLANAYRPKGDPAKWHDAAKLVTANRVDLQAIVAASFAAPLMRFTGHRGVIVSAWSRQSGVGKSSAMMVGQAVWSSSNIMNALNDTGNSVFAKVAASRTMPCYWDEMQVGSDNAKAMVQMAFNLSGGKGKGRMAADTSLREVGTWETILVAAANKPFMDSVTAEHAASEAGALRVFEFPIVIPPVADNSKSARIIAGVHDNYGHAGRVYAKWLAANQPTADAVVSHYKDVLSQQLGAEQSERLYVAAIAAILGGARLASHVGILQFDLPKLQEFLSEQFRKLRAARKRDISVSANGYDLDQLFGNFMADHAGDRMVTSCFIKQGPHPGKFKVMWYPPSKTRVCVQIGQKEKLMRVDRAALYEWCRKKGYAASDVSENIQKQWGAVLGRRVLAGGTGYAGGQVWTLDIDLSKRIELDGYLHVDASTQGGAGTTQGAASPGAGLGATPPAGP